MTQNIKRLFFGMEVRAPWPEDFPAGRLLDENHRHMTLAFLGDTDIVRMKDALESFPKPDFKVGFAAKFDQCLFLPPRHPRVVAWHVQWLESASETVSCYVNVLLDWLDSKGFSPDRRHAHFLPHVTLARAPFHEKMWRKQFFQLPAVVQNVHLYASLGNLKYEPVWSCPLLPPFEEFEHTADIAFYVRGETYNDLFQHACLALCFNFPQLLEFTESKKGFEQLEDIIIELNHLIARADQEIGCPFKAVSFHSHLTTQDSILTWEMIIDV